MKPVIAMDGPAGSGKGTIAKKLASHFNFAYLDTGMLYRAIAHLGIEVGKIEELSAAEILKTAREIPMSVLKSDIVGLKASKIAKSPEIREVMTRLQRDFVVCPGDNHRGSVLDGRDIGTVVIPDAVCKIFVTASPEIRATRRFRSLKRNNDQITYAEVLESLIARDKQDQSREIAPLTLNDAYVVLDTSKETVRESFLRAIKIVENSLKSVEP
ncbi:MAG: nucleoside monophosphate kinase [Holosporaceae bacterium]|jgi:cytidylate kinase|nr:nucleoside monophosphate kinase [Holosporaceae bacterium]